MNGWVDAAGRALLRLRRTLQAEEGQGMTEYALLVILIAIVVVLMLGILGKQTNNVFSNISNGLGG